jgi:hypothetical protein
VVADHVVQQSVRMNPAWVVLIGAVKVHLIVLVLVPVNVNVPVIVIVAVVGFATLVHTPWPPWPPCSLVVQTSSCSRAPAYIAGASAVVVVAGVAVVVVVVAWFGV